MLKNSEKFQFFVQESVQQKYFSKRKMFRNVP